MSDIVERLDEFLGPLWANVSRDALEAIHDAKGEITRLRADNERLRERLGPRGLEVVDIDGAGHYVNAKVKDEIARLRADKDALLAALKPFSDAYWEHVSTDPDGTLTGSDDITAGDVRRARAAIKTAEEGK